MGQYEPLNTTIYIDKVELRNVSATSLRSSTVGPINQCEITTDVHPIVDIENIDNCELLITHTDGCGHGYVIQLKNCKLTHNGFLADVDSFKWKYSLRSENNAVVIAVDEEVVDAIHDFCQMGEVEDEIDNLIENYTIKCSSVNHDK